MVFIYAGKSFKLRFQKVHAILEKFRETWEWTEVPRERTPTEASQILVIKRSLGGKAMSRV